MEVAATVIEAVNVKGRSASVAGTLHQRINETNLGKKSAEIAGRSGKANDLQR